MRRVVVTGLGLITSIGNGRAEVLESLRTQRSGIELHPEFDRPESPVRLAGTIKGFQFPAENPERWKLPPGLTIPRVHLRSLAPHGAFAYAAMREAISDANLSEATISNERTGMFCASAGSTRLLTRNVEKMLRDGAQRLSPVCIPASITGTLNFNLVSAFKIKGASTGFVSACSSSAHALGFASDLVRQNRQDVMFVVGAEDGDFFSIVPFASCRALSTATDPAKGSRPFDVARDGFVGTGGAAVVVLEELEHAQRRNAPIYAEVAGWAQTSDGFDIMSPEPNGEGLARAMRAALADAQISAREVDYINAHATSTVTGDRAELRAIKSVFGADNDGPLVSSTKSQTGHGLSLAGAMEAGICCLAIKEKLTPVSLNITELDPEADGVRVVTSSIPDAPKTVLSNSSAFGGSNVVLALQRVD